MAAVKAKLLLVDDDALVLEFVGQFLSQCGYELRAACDGDEAVSIAREFHPDCVVTGIVMPRMDGFQEADAILLFLPACKFVFMSGSAHVPEIRKQYEQRFADPELLLSKPFARADLLKALTRAGFPCSGAL